MTENKLMKKRICKVCGKKFIANRADAKTCSSKCRQALYRANPNVVKNKPAAKKDWYKLGVVKTEQGLEFRYPQAIMRGETASVFIKAISTLIKNTRLTMNDVLYKKTRGSVDDFIKLARMDIDSQKRIIDIVLTGKADIELAATMVNREKRNTLLKEAERRRLGK